jgi:hypothetical protein
MDSNELDQEQITEATEPADDGQRNRTLGAAMWIGSAVTHATALALMGAIYWTVASQEEIEIPPSYIPVLPEMVKKDPPPKTDPIEQVSIDMPEVAEDPQVKTILETPLIDEVSGDPDSQVTDQPPMEQGKEDANSDMAMSNSNAAVFAAIGAGNSAPSKTGGVGAYGPRTTKKKIGAPKFAITTTQSALRWFKRHQGPDGRWDAVDYWKNCTEDGVKGEPGKDQSGDTDVAMTAYAVLCFLGDGHDGSTATTYRKVVRNGIDALLAMQKPDGLIGQRNYEHAIATMALTQAYGMSPDPRLREPCQRAVDVILARQNRDPKAADAAYGGLGWDYGGPTDRNDSSVTGWNVMALKAAYVGGLSVGNGLDSSKRWLDRHWAASNTGKPWCADPTKLDPYTGISRFAYVWKPSTGETQISDWNAAANRPASVDSHDMASVGLMCAVFLGHRAGDPMLESLGNYVAKYQMPTAWPMNTYYLYYNTLGMYQLGGERWKTWAGTVLPLLAGAQRSDDGCMNGSWDWEGTKFHGHDTGRVLSTAYACLSMQVYWYYAKQTADAKKAR